MQTFSNSRPSTPPFRHIIVHFEDEQAVFAPQHPEKLSANPLTHNVESADVHHDIDVIQLHSSEFNHLDPPDLISHLAKTVSDIVVLDSWPCGTQPIVWIAPSSELQLNPAMAAIEVLRSEFSDEALDIIFVIEGERGKTSNKYREPQWLRKAWTEIGNFAYCGTVDAVCNVLHHTTQLGDSEMLKTCSKKQRRPWEVKEPRRPDVTGCFSFGKRKAEPVDTIRFYDREKPWYQFTNFFQGVGFFWEPTLEKFRSVEHFFQAMKTTDPAERVKIALAASARNALNIARNSTSMRWYWDQQCLCGDLFKERIMFIALMQKFSVEEPRLRTLLLSTGTCQLSEASRVDSYWGSGDDGKGKNRLGFLLEKVRVAIQREECLARRAYNHFESKFQELWH
ncbi:hypothetical protein BGZ81_010301 [Podila clonocystis]|nr:hypothetical protein BGZ81_010301 [Podila clonocystis]